MAKNKHTAMLPNGEIVTRNSESRTYSHCVAYQVDGAAVLAEETARKICRTVRSNFAYYTAYIDGTSAYLPQKKWESDEVYVERRADDIAKAVKALNGATSAEEWFAANKAAQIARCEADIAAGVYDRWHVAGWCGRLDLAAKLATSTDGPRTKAVVILPTTLL